MTKKIIKVAIAIVMKEQQVLVALRDPKQHQGGLWEFPGGKVNSGESFAEAALRELEEEVAVIGRDPQLIWQTEHDYGDRVVQLQAFTLSYWRGEAQSKEGNPIQWIALDKLPQLPMPAANTELNQLLQTL
ncbi:NUDIX domain-containing protein [uncultured Ferrimonas sp.]|uniref:NUDIX domain-containing protein n=1 Tax=uncultured Ferrimonas sp. TaxID=432640 RepID=UPI00262E9A34|nr:NUDIX domain-containing protein [uncultured Ferrimonas sp.]